MLGSSIRVATVFGIPIKLDLSLLILAVMLLVRYGPVYGVAYGVFATLALLVSIVLHELGHSLVGMAFGCRVREITLMFLGGQAALDRIPRRPWQEFLMALAGPAVSVALGIGGLLAAPLARGLAGETGVHFLAWQVGYLNLALFVFNLLPAFPMDGGRVFRAVLAQALGRLRATYIAMLVGRGVAILMGAYAVWASEYLLLAIALFVFFAAGQEYRGVQIEEGYRRRGERPPWEPPPPPDDVYVGPPPYGRDRR
jgi:Zn-dependent protease